MPLSLKPVIVVNDSLRGIISPATALLAVAVVIVAIEGVRGVAAVMNTIPLTEEKKQKVVMMMMMTTREKEREREEGICIRSMNWYI